MDDYGLSLTDLESSGIIGFIESDQPQRYHEIILWTVRQAEAFAEDGQVGKAQVLALVEQLCRLRFNLEDRRNPFALDSLPVDFSLHVEFVRAAADSSLIPDGVFKARLLDVSSLLTRNHIHALKALEQYANLPL